MVGSCKILLMGANSHADIQVEHNCLEQVMSERFEPLNSREVVSTHKDNQVLSGQRIFKVSDFNEAIVAHLAKAISGWTEAESAWFEPEGIDCEALRFGSSDWQKGRIRLSLEFRPDEPSLGAQETFGKAMPILSQSSEASDLVHHADLPTIEPVATTQSVATSLPEIHSIQPTQSVAAVDLSAPLVTDVLLDELTLEHNDDRGAGLEEIAFDFDRSHGVYGTMSSNNAMMELDLTDLGLDDELDFEAEEMLDGRHDLINLYGSSDCPEYSGMLIDEVWNELNNRQLPEIT